jgi:hypothetical protein
VLHQWHMGFLAGRTWNRLPEWNLDGEDLSAVNALEVRHAG